MIKERVELDLDEIWIFTSEYKIPANQTAPVVNTVEACGFESRGQEESVSRFIEQNILVDDSDEQVCDDDSHTLRIPQVLGDSTTVVPPTPKPVVAAALATTGTNYTLNFVAGLALAGTALFVTLTRRTNKS
mgnify:CR=1 FL=1